VVYVVPGAGIISPHIKTPREEIEPVADKPVTVMLASPVTLLVPNDDVIAPIVFVVKKLPKVAVPETPFCVSKTMPKLAVVPNPVVVMFASPVVETDPTDAVAFVPIATSLPQPPSPQPVVDEFHPNPSETTTLVITQS
jgi:hypothetical protein